MAKRGLNIEKRYVMLPVIPVVVAVTTAAVLVKRKLTRLANKHKFAELLAYANSSDVPIDSDGHFDPNAKRADGLPLLYGLMSSPDLLGALIEYGANPNIRDADETPAIIYAVKNYDSIQLVSTMLKYGADPNAMDCDGRTAIFYAKSKDIVNVLCKGGAFLDTADVFGKTAIFFSFDFHTTDEFVRLGADVNVKDSDGKALIFYANSFFELKLLCHAGADVNVKDSDGRTPIFYARSFSELELLCQAGADVNVKDSDGRTPLFYAKSYEALNLLSKYGADFTVKDSFGKTPLFYAKSVEDLTLFSQFGIDLNAVDNDGKTVLFYSFEHHTTEALVKMGADVNVRDREGNTVLFYITSPKNYNLVKLLLSRGADLAATNNEGKKFKYYDTYYHYFVEELGHNFYDAVNNNIIKVQELLKKGVNLDTRDVSIEDWNMIHLAVYRHNPRMIEVLAKGGVDINAKIGGNICPLEKAVYERDIECIKMLLKCGADPSLARSAVLYNSIDEIQQIFEEYEKNRQ